MNEVSFLELLSDINSSLSKIKETPKLEPVNDFIEIDGIPNLGALNLLFSDKIDDLLNKLLDMVASGKFDLAGTLEPLLGSFFNKLGLGEGTFKGKISTSVMNNINKIVNSDKFKKTPGKIKRSLMFLKGMKKGRRDLVDKEDREKYDKAVEAIKQVLKYINVIYKYRSLINEKTLKGLSTFINEDEEIK